MQIFFSTVVRTAPLRRGGEVLRVDWETKSVRARAAAVPTRPELGDPNPRGGRRGGTGIAVLGDQVAVAAYDSVRLFDRDLRLQRVISHPLMVGLHEIHPGTDGSLWVAATAIDAALRFDLSTGELIGQFWPREMPVLQQRLGLVPSDIDKAVDNRYRWMSGEHLQHPSHLHLNAVTTWNGGTYALFSKFAAIVRLDRGEVVIEDPALRGGHNLLIQDDGTAFVNVTAGHGIRIFDLKARTLLRAIDVLRFDWIRQLVRAGRGGRAARLRRKVARRLRVARFDPRVARPLFMRGMSLAGESLFVGTSPGSILNVDWKRGELIDAFNYSRDLRVAIHGVQAASW